MSYRIRMQADAFFKAHKVLEDNFDTATLAVMGPGVVCLAFAVELYIKEIYQVLRLEPPRGRDGHNILKLFQRLPDGVQKEIFGHDAVNTGIVQGDILSPKRFTSEYSFFEAFMYELWTISEGFTDWRYSHERPDPETGKGTTLRYNSGFAEAFVTAIKSVSDSARVKEAA